MLLRRLDSNKTLKVVQVYDTTIANDDDMAEEFYDDPESTLVVKSTCAVVLGDFNGKLGREGKADGGRNNRMAAVAETNRLFVGHTFF